MPIQSPFESKGIDLATENALHVDNRFDAHRGDG
jgi:hypothetical protein